MFICSSLATRVFVRPRYTYADYRIYRLYANYIVINFIKKTDINTRYLVNQGFYFVL